MAKFPPQEQKAPEPEPRVVEAVAYAASTATSGDRLLAPVLEKAVSIAIMRAYGEGIGNDPALVRERMMDARQKAKDAYYAGDAETLKTLLDE